MLLFPLFSLLFSCQSFVAPSVSFLIRFRGTYPRAYAHIFPLAYPAFARIFAVNPSKRNFEITEGLGHVKVRAVRQFRLRMVDVL